MAGQVSHLLARWSEGDADALDQLMPIVYNELRSLGRGCLARRPPQAVLQPTVLVHEAWIRLAAKQELSLDSRLQFFALAAKIIRDILVDHFRRRQASKRGGSQIEVPLDAAQDPHVGSGADLLFLDQAINRLSDIKPRYARIVELKFFAGLTIEESAEVLQVSHSTIEREWNFARLWLRRELGSHSTRP